MKKNFLPILEFCRNNDEYTQDLEHRLQKLGYYFEASFLLIEAFQFTIDIHVVMPTINTRDQCTQTLDGDDYEKIKDENETLSRENSALKSLLEKVRTLNMQLVHEREMVLRENKILKEEAVKLTKELDEVKMEHRETLIELGEMLVVRTAEINKASEAEIFQTIFHSKSPTSTVEHFEHNSFPSAQMSGSDDKHINQSRTVSLPTTSRSKPASSSAEPCFSARGTNDQTKGCENQNQSNISPHVKTNSAFVPIDETTSSAENLSFPIQVNQLGEKERINLTDQPTSSITANVRNNYKLLLLTAADNLLASDIVRLKEWASEKFSIEPNGSAIKIIFELDKKGVINAFDLSELLTFLESIVRHDLVFIIDEFCAGDYTSLRRLIHSGYKRTHRGATCAHTGLSQVVHVASDTVSSRPLSRVTNNAGSNRIVERKRATIVHTATSNVGDERSRKTLNQNHPEKGNPSVGFTGAVASSNPDVVADGQEMNNTRGLSQSNAIK